MSEFPVPSLNFLYVPYRLPWKTLAAILVAFVAVFAVIEPLHWRSLPQAIQWT
jgi:hypothetical protein